MTEHTAQDLTVTVRPARADDLPGLVASSTALFAEDAGTRDPSVDADWPREHAAASFTAALDDQARLVLAVEYAGAVVGHLMGSLAEPTAIRPVKAATLISVYVRPAHRSSGAGARMVEAFVQWAAERGAEHAEVTAYAANTDAIRFYERNGFAPQTVTLRRGL
ncbi:GNAT family N-acetyltransferase [Streptomyces sp. NBC_00576]|uniref:GNAT family N-acetyltransferase n=1 Tax=Streptomyces sp. NBC_00576 TaxID=2903665 RepID=UPI002E80B8CC|nr:GNAT family N-acetyltransferase [Streptomyces sp. NBC_00576]WUB69261.1 GNAT family N-acetyltransferase [Streptomyces sp. NBC_00576]